MRITFWQILTTAFIILGLSYYFIPFVRYLLIPFSGGTKAPESLMMRFLEVNTAVDTQTQKLTLADRAQEVTSIDQVPEQGGWINSLALDLDDLYKQNKSILIFFWNSCCMKCLRTVPYIQEFWDRYKNHGLTVIGVHTPSLEFEKDPRIVLKEVDRSAITYPVTTDGNKKIWKKFGNHFSPALYLINPQGTIVYTHFGEGNHSQTEHVIRQTLKKAGYNLPLSQSSPEYLDPVIRRSTQELHAGAKLLQKPYGNVEQPHINRTVLFSLPSKIEPDKIYVEGMFESASDYIQNKTEGKIIVNYLANAPYIILGPADEKNPINVEVLLDDQPIPQEVQGIDIKNNGDKKIMLVDKSRIYYPLAHKTRYGRHTITLKAPPGLRFYSIQFGTY